MSREKFTPIPGKVYKNQGGGEYRCLRADGIFLPFTATMQNTASGWTFIARGCGIYTDGTIDWDYSTGGKFETILS